MPSIAELHAPGQQLLVAVAPGRKREVTELAAIGCQSHADLEIAVDADVDKVIERDRVLLAWQDCRPNRCRMMVGRAIRAGRRTDVCRVALGFRAAVDTSWPDS